MARLAAALVAATAFLAVVNVGPAEAALRPIYRATLQNHATGACLDDSAVGVRAFSCNGTNFQIWQVNWEDTSGYFESPVELINVATGGCLDDSPQQHLRVTRCNGMWGGYQAWKVRNWTGSDGLAYNEYLNTATGLCLDDSPNGLRTTGCNAGWGGYQLWRVITR